MRKKLKIGKIFLFFLSDDLKGGYVTHTINAVIATNNVRMTCFLNSINRM